MPSFFLVYAHMGKWVEALVLGGVVVVGIRDEEANKERSRVVGLKPRGDRALSIPTCNGRRVAGGGE